MTVLKKPHIPVNLMLGTQQVLYHPYYCVRGDSFCRVDNELTLSASEGAEEALVADDTTCPPAEESTPDIPVDEAQVRQSSG
ncbi:hypothetical protein FACS189472_15040 [Alphaproteobacteria bacterium]|nr:hypothetical protein FACS189472_15040 [Alphaproteobacteria bacterium]